jgi:hypothetical protein
VCSWPKLAGKGCPQPFCLLFSTGPPGSFSSITQHRSAKAVSNSLSDTRQDASVSLYHIRSFFALFSSAASGSEQSRDPGQDELLRGTAEASRRRWILCRASLISVGQCLPGDAQASGARAQTRAHGIRERVQIRPPPLRQRGLRVPDRAKRGVSNVPVSTLTLTQIQNSARPTGYATGSLSAVTRPGSPLHNAVGFLCLRLPGQHKV